MKELTLALLPRARAQEVFDFIARHLLRQQKRSVFAPDKAFALRCRYRTPDGLACAAGCLLTAEEAADREGSSWYRLAMDKMVPLEHVLLIRRLQLVHDNQKIGVKDWPAELREVASEFSLSATVVDAYQPR